jgi:hypothetical protein
MISFWVLFMITLNWHFLALSLTGYIPSWLGHLFFEGKEPPTLRKPWVSGMANFKMVGMIVGGALPAELKRLFGSENPATGSAILISEKDEIIYQEKLRFYIGARFPKHPFTSYWDIFLLKHQNPVNIWLHVFAMFFLYGVILAAVLTQKWQLLFLVPLSPISGLFAHNYFEPTHVDFEDAIFSPRAFVCLNKMMVRAVTGSYWRELARVKAELQEFLIKS